ncbi:hypothetical protein GGR52DRAFT_290318 [Hypoxylon sp. FL1284]|nr:hypothetical protein GGR52DRAFT_290318 [Hypoxylon sp. FL1284]
MASRGNITPRTIMAPAAAFTMACVLFVNTSESRGEASRVAKAAPREISNQYPAHPAHPARKSTNFHRSLSNLVRHIVYLVRSGSRRGPARPQKGGIGRSDAQERAAFIHLIGVARRLSKPDRRWSEAAGGDVIRDFLEA